MPRRIRHLPVLQNWDCHACGTCCHEYRVFVTESERQRIAGQGWEKDEALHNLPLFVRHGPPWAPRYRLNQREDGACVFLSPEGRCRIHERFGGEAKPLACQLYPFILVPAGNQWRVGLRFSCPSTVQNKGRPLVDHQDELIAFARGLEKELGEDLGRLAPPRLDRRQSIGWDDLFRIVDGLVSILRDPSDRFELRVRKVLALTHLCRQSRLHSIQGKRLSEFLDLVQASLADEVPHDPATVAPPTWVGRVLFRQAASVHMRRDQGPNRTLEPGRLASLRAGWRFARGSGLLPQVHRAVPAITFAQLEEPAGTLPDDAVALLERYYNTKVSSLQFFGAAHFGFGFWEGVEALCLTFPIVLWVSRALGQMPRNEALALAISMVDHNFGYNPALGSSRHRLSLRILGRRRELEKLTSWYSR